VQQVALTKWDWATLLKHVWGFDALTCPGCGGRMRFIAVIKDRAVIEHILKHIGEDAEEPRFGPRALPRQGASSSDAIRANPAPRGEPRGYRVQAPQTRASCVALDDPKSPAQAGLVLGSPGVHS
jgi:hypothetical protein